MMMLNRREVYDDFAAIGFKAGKDGLLVTCFRMFCHRIHELQEGNEGEIKGRKEGRIAGCPRQGWRGDRAGAGGKVSSVYALIIRFLWTAQ
jgi:hypothetical protein